MDLFSLVARLRLDSSEYEEGIKRSELGASSLGGAFKKIGVVASAAVAAATVAVGALTKSAVQSYAEYEQLAGGVKKLFGEEASAEVMKYANEAYKTSGMSANKYMEQATSFSAALINSLNGDQLKAAEQTDVAMRAISDNWNTFGGDIGNIQYAFQGFAKQNYTMLDNLKLGYGGTKTEMERLIADANEYAAANGMAADLSIDSFSDIVTAIDLIQQKQGIAGTTAKEAATTIEGSLNMTRAAWENLVAGLANPDADIGQLMDNLVSAIVGENEGEGLLNQIAPAIQRAMEGVGQLLERATPILVDQLPALVETMVPALINSAVALVQGLVSALPTIVGVLVAQMPTIIESITTALTESLPMLAAVAPQLMLTLATGIGQSLPTLIPVIVQVVLSMVEAFANNADLLVDAAIALMQGLAVGFIRAVPILVSKVPSVISSVRAAVIRGAGKLISAGLKLATQLGNGITRGIGSIVSKVTSAAKKIPNAVKKGLGNLRSVGTNLIEGLWGGIKAKFDSVIARVKALAAKLPKSVKKVLGISSPSKVFAEVGKWIPEGLALGIERNMDSVYDATDALADATMLDSVSSSTASGTSSGANAMPALHDTLVSAITEGMENITVTLDRRAFGKMTRKAVGAL